MTGQELFNELFLTLLRIGPTEKNIELYKEIQESLNDFVLVDSFNQLKKNDKGEGLALEILLFNKDKVYDIVFTSTTVDFTIIIIKSITKVNIVISYGQSTNTQGQISVVDLLNFTISYGNDFTLLTYTTEVKRFSEINRIKTNLLNLVIK